MKKTLLSTVALVGLTVGAMAADLPSRAPPPIIPVPIFTWTGFYVGLNAGYGFGDDDKRDVFIPTGTFPAPFAGTTGVLVHGDTNRDGFVGGGQIGYNYQFGTFVVGVEADIQYADLGGGNDNGFAVFTGTGVLPPGFIAAGRRHHGLDWFGTVRARAGVAFDRALIYATGGFAYGGGDEGDECGALFFGPFVDCGGGDDVRGGWTVGGGVEYAFTYNWTAKLEALYVNIERGGRNTGFIGTFNGAPVFVVDDRKNDLEFGVIRAGINYKF